MGRAPAVALALALAGTALAQPLDLALRDALLDAEPRDAPALALAAVLPLAEGPGSLALQHLARLVGVVPAPAFGMPEPPWLGDAPAALRPGLAVLAQGQAEAAAHVAAALADLDAAERQRLFDDLPRAHAAVGAAGLGAATSEDEAFLAAFASLAARVRLPHMAAAGMALLDAAERAAPLLQGVETGPWPDAHCASGSVAFEAAGCFVVVGGAGPTTFSVDSAIAVDLDGADTYLTRAGGATGGAALLLDLGGDGDTYLTAGLGPQDAAQGSGSAGAGLLYDDGGDDDYTVVASGIGASARVAAQGTGFVGFGALLDMGGDDDYTSRNLAQGTSLIGFGLLLDEGGDDDYVVGLTYDSEVAQGAACFGGAAALLDRGAGQDTYDAGIADLQGFGCAGALGVLLDGGGNDAYTVRSGPGDVLGLATQQSGWGQGYAEAGGAAVLLDLGGHDDYLVEVLLGGAFEGFHAQGAGNVASAALLLDRRGDDTYAAKERAQGFGFGGLGVLADARGDDSYAATSLCQGSGLLGTGLLLDAGGGTDTYLCGEPALPSGRGDGKAWVSGSAGLGADV